LKSLLTKKIRLKIKMMKNPFLEKFKGKSLFFKKSKKCLIYCKDGGGNGLFSTLAKLNFSL